MGFLAISLALLAIIGFVMPSTHANDRFAYLDFMSSIDPSSSIFPWSDIMQNINSDDDYCQWLGVLKCDKNNRVVNVSLENLGLNGTILNDLFSRLDKLENLSLRQNKLGGTIPPLSQAINLQTLALDGNELSGPIPSSLPNSASLKVINLSNNHLDGKLPNSSYFASLLSFDVSNNNLSGPIPPSLSHFDKSSFEANPHLCGKPLNTTCPTEKPSHKGVNKTIVVGIIIGVGVGASLIALGLLWFKRKKSQQMLVKHSSPSDQGSRQSDPSSNDKATKKSFESVRKKEISPIKEPRNVIFTQELSSDSIDEKGNLGFIDGVNRPFELEDLLKGSAEILGRGLLGSSYKATLGGDFEVVVKRLSLLNNCEKDAFMETMKAIGRAKHPNVLPLRAHFFGKEEKLLVYEYMPHGSLFNALHTVEGRRDTRLDWISRIKIATGVASALDYIHTTYASLLASSPSLMCNHRKVVGVHGNLKSSNILLGADKDAYVADFGMAAMVASTAALSYMASQRAPECKSGPKKLTASADVYSYGVLLLELLTGKMPLQAYNGGGGQGVDLPGWVESVIREEWTAEVFDRELACSKVEEEELVSLLKLAMACISPQLDQRPSMSQVLHTIHQQIRSFQAFDTPGPFHGQQHYFHGPAAAGHGVHRVNDPHHFDTPSSDRFSFSFEGHVSRLDSEDSFQQ